MLLMCADLNPAHEAYHGVSTHVADVSQAALALSAATEMTFDNVHTLTLSVVLLNHRPWTRSCYSSLRQQQAFVSCDLR